MAKIETFSYHISIHFWSDCSQMGQIRGFFSSDSVHFGAPRQNVPNLIWKKTPDLLHLGANLTHLGPKSGHPGMALVSLLWLCVCVIAGNVSNVVRPHLARLSRYSPLCGYNQGSCITVGLTTQTG